jgi:hypothetical protein
MIDGQNPEARRENLAHAGKLSRTFATLLEALNRHRGKGQQKMTVEHVHVHSGGQAVVAWSGRQGPALTLTRTNPPALNLVDPLSAQG